MTNTFKISSCSDPPSAFLSFQIYVLSWSRSSVVCPGPSGSCDALTVAFGTGIRTITLVPELGGREEGEKEGRWRRIGMKEGRRGRWGRVEEVE